MDILEVASNKDKKIPKTQIMLPFGGRKDNKLMTKIKKHLEKSLTKDIKTNVEYQSNKLSTKFR